MAEKREWVWIVLFVVSILLFFLSDAYRNVRELLIYGILLGVAGAIIEYLGQRTYCCWTTQQRFSIFKLPVLLILTYFVGGMLIIHFLPVSLTNQIIYVLGLIVGTVLLEYGLIRMGHVKWHKHYPNLCITIHTIVIVALVVLHRVFPTN